MMKRHLTKYILLFLLTTVHTELTFKDAKALFKRSWYGDDLVCKFFYLIKVALSVFALYCLWSLIKCVIYKSVK